MIGIKSKMQNERLSPRTVGGVTWLNNQAAAYNDDTLFNPFSSFYHGVKSIFFVMRANFIWFDHVIYSIFWFFIIAIHWHVDEHVNVISGSDSVMSIMKKIGNLTVFILAFYLSLGMSRWWRLRTVGIADIYDCNNDLAMDLGIIYNTIKKDGNYNHLLRPLWNHIDKIKRYSAASLYVFFLQGKQKGFTWSNIREYGILHLDECKLIRSLNGCESDYLWALIYAECVAILQLFDKEAVFDRMAHSYWWTIPELCRKGRIAAGGIAAQLGCQIPFDYASAVRFLVHMDNIGTFVAYGAVAINYIQNTTEDTALICFFLGFEFLLMHFWAVLLNLLMIIAIEMENPFNDHRMSFPGWKYINGMRTDFDKLLNIDSD